MELTMADTETLVPFINGNGTLQAQQSLLLTSGAVAPEMGIRANSAVISATNPLPTQPPPLPGIYSTTAEAYHVLKTSAGTLYSVHFNCTEIGWLLLLDANELPSNGAVSPRRAWYFTAAGEATIDKTFNPPLQMTNGAVLVFSSTGPFALTLSDPVAQFSAEMQ
jgi:hypothetical protein